jgi:calcium-dependent protein kinase
MKLNHELKLEPGTQFSRIVKSPSMKAFKNKYKISKGSVLGSGMSGSVLTAVDRSTGGDVAVKCLSVVDLDARARERVLQEIDIQLAMDHPHICRLLEVYEEPTKLRLVLERLRGPSIFDHLTKKTKYCERDAGICVRQMCLAIQYIHSKNVCHRDLKLENFCLEDDSPDARVKMIDFGLSERCPDGTKMTHACGSLVYVAPDVLLESYDMKCDMWSLGVIAYALLFGEAPFEGRDDRETAKKICEGRFTFPSATRVSSKAQEFIKALLCLDPRKRLSAEEALDHRWLVEVELATFHTEALDPSVLKGVSRLAKSNPLKQAVLKALAPAANLQQVTQWADQFQALDENNSGTIPLSALTKHLTCGIFVDEESEYQMIAEEIANGEEEISYSEFLAACLAAHLKLNEKQVQELFQRMDVDNNQEVSLDDIEKALGKQVMEDLRAAQGDDPLSYEEFKWLLLGPVGSATCVGMLEQLGPQDLTHKWRTQTARAKDRDLGEAEDLEAARVENMAWRRMAMNLDASPGAEEQTATHVQPRKATKALVKEVENKSSNEALLGWALATSVAKNNDPEARRKENMAWRVLAKHRLQKEMV